jgi:serine O-acetyltransferase
MIGRRLQLPHPTGIVIGHGVTIEDDVTILQNVTLGHLGDGSGADAYPVIKSGSAIYAGAKIIGAVVVGPNAKIGANAVVLKDVPEGNAAIGVPAKNCEPKP